MLWCGLVCAMRLVLTTLLFVIRTSGSVPDGPAALLIDNFIECWLATERRGVGTRQITVPVPGDRPSHLTETAAPLTSAPAPNQLPWL